MEEYDTAGGIINITYYDDKGRESSKKDGAGNIVQGWIYGDSDLSDLPDVLEELRAIRDNPDEPPERQAAASDIIERLENLSEEPNVGAKLLWVEHCDATGGIYQRDFYDECKKLRISVQTTVPTPLGDVSGDGKVTAYDASLVLKYVVGLLDIEPDSEQWRAADVSGNSNINAYDATLILQYCVGLITKFPADPTAAAPALDPKSEGKLLAEAIAQLETVSLNNEQSRILEQLKLLVFNQLALPYTALLQNFPNPFNPETWLPYQLAKDSEVAICIYNSKGQLVRRLDLGKQKAGAYTSKKRAAYWNGRNSYGEQVSSGVYFYTLQVREASTRIRAGEFRATRKMVIMK